MKFIQRIHYQILSKASFSYFTFWTNYYLLRPRYTYCRQNLKKWLLTKQKNKETGSRALKLLENCENCAGSSAQFVIIFVMMHSEK